MKFYFDETGDFAVPSSLDQPAAGIVVGISVPETAEPEVFRRFKLIIDRLPSSAFKNGEPKGAQFPSWIYYPASKVGSLAAINRALFSFKKPKEGIPMQLVELPTKEAAIIARLDFSDRPPLSREAAEDILAIGFSQADKDRMNALAAKTRKGRLTPDERAEAEAYSRIGSLLGILKSKARQSLRSYSSM